MRCDCLDPKCRDCFPVIPQPLDVRRLIAHVGCGSVDEHGRCELCDAIRAALLALPTEPSRTHLGYVDRSGRCSCCGKTGLFGVDEDTICLPTEQTEPTS
jgi:hypothetical protein